VTRTTILRTREHEGEGYKNGIKLQDVSIIDRSKEVAMPVKPIPDGYSSITPYLYIRGASAAIDFYKKAFGAQELFRLPGPDGRIGHAELKIGNAIVMLADEHPEANAISPQTLNGTSVGILFYVNGVDDVIARAVAGGAKIERPTQNQFYGDRSGTIVDPFGHKWTVATHVENVSPEEMESRIKKMQPPQQ
jgi:PhnB protein